MFGFACSASGGTAASSWARSSGDAFWDPMARFAPANMAPPRKALVPFLVTMLKTMPPCVTSADAPPSW